MKKIIEIIPNFSVSKEKDEDTFNALVDVSKSREDVLLLDAQSDVDHNRSVFTLIGSPDGVEEIAFMLTKCASENIDMNYHHGEHSRMGATDVLPFVPTINTTIEECIEMSKRVAKRIWDNLSIPSFLYEESATKPERKNLATVRKGQWEGMPEKLKDPDWAPDFGERKMHPTAGIMAIGARKCLVAFNVNLKTGDVEIAKKIAKEIRESSGGYKDVKAMGFMLEDRGIAQVSMNMCDYNTTGLHIVFDKISQLAKQYGTEVLESELVGTTPAKALLDAAQHYLKITDFDAFKQTMEYKLI